MDGCENIEQGWALGVGKEVSALRKRCEEAHKKGALGDALVAQQFWISEQGPARPTIRCKAGLRHCPGCTRYCRSMFPSDL